MPPPTRCPTCSSEKLQYAKGACPNRNCGCETYYCETCGQMFLVMWGESPTLLEPMYDVSS